MYPNMANLQEKKSILFHLASSMGGTIEIRSGDANGKLLGRARVKSTGGNGNYTCVSCKLKDTKAVEDICLVFFGNGKDLMHLNYFSFGE